MNPNQAPTTNDAIIKGKSYAEEEKQRNVPHLSEDHAKSSEGYIFVRDRIHSVPDYNSTRVGVVVVVVVVIVVVVADFTMG